MATLASIPGIETFIREAVQIRRMSHEQVGINLRAAYPHLRGLSTASVKRYCLDNDIHKTSRLDQPTVNRLVSLNVMRVGPQYGRKTMTGLLSSQGFRVAQSRVGHALRITHPGYHSTRQSLTERQTNPHPYIANYYGEKLHIDQNEKLVAFGVTHVCAIDGFTGRIMAMCSMPVKNNVIIYEHIFLKNTKDNGLWNQIRVDHGREWVLMLYAQDHLSHLRHDLSKAPFLQTSSKRNHVVERIWVEVNTRVNYPIKRILIVMADSEEIDMDNPLHKFCTSWFTLSVAQVGLTLLVSSWNEHPIPGRRHGLPQGVPNQRVYIDNRVKQIDHSLLWTPAEAVQMYRRNGGRITDPAGFGIDPLLGDTAKLEIRRQAFADRIPSFDVIFSSAVNGDDRPFREGLLFLCDITYRLSCS